MTRALFFLFTAMALFFITTATKVQQCGTGKWLDDTTSIQITNCEKPPCKLKKGTTVGIEQKFTPTEDIESLVTSVHATIFTVPLPFLGVDGFDACSKIFKSSDGTPAGCPLQKNVEYVYKNEFPVLHIYPTVDLVVYWALKEKQKVVTCFEVPAKIF